MSRVLGGGKDRLDLKPLSAEGNRSGNDYPELDEMVGCHAGSSSGLNIVPRPGYDEDEERRILEALHGHIGAGVELSVRHVDRIEKTAIGKHRFLIQEIESA